MTAQVTVTRERQDVASATSGSDGGRPDPHALLSRPPLPRRPSIEADAEPRRLALHATMTQLFLRFDPTHDLPHVLETVTGKIVARFEKDADLAWFICRGKTERPTLPEAYVFQLTGGQV